MPVDTNELTLFTLVVVGGGGGGWGEGHNKVHARKFIAFLYQSKHYQTSSLFLKNYLPTIRYKN